MLHRFLQINNAMTPPETLVVGLKKMLFFYAVVLLSGHFRLTLRKVVVAVRRDRRK